MNYSSLALGFLIVVTAFATGSANAQSFSSAMAPAAWMPTPPTWANGDSEDKGAIPYFLTAVQTTIGRVSSDCDSDKGELIAVANETGELTHLINKVTKPSGVEVKTYSVAQLRTGVPLLRKSAMMMTWDVVSLQLTRFDSKSGGEATLTLLREAGLFSSDYRVLRVRISQVQGKWTLFTDERDGVRNFDEMFVETNFVDGSPKGIKAMVTRLEGKDVGRYDTSTLSEP